MKHAAWLGFLILAGGDAAAQQRGGSAHNSFARVGASRSARIRGRGGVGNQRFGPRSFGDYYPYPLFDDGYDFEYPYEYENGFSQNVVEQPVRPVVIRQAPPPVVKSEIHSYEIGAPSPAPAAEQPAFVIALNDGSRVIATAVWVQDGLVHYIDTGDLSRQVPLTSVERELTRKLNQERNLNLRLPPPR
jgi:hypothetical protein